MHEVYKIVPAAVKYPRGLNNLYFIKCDLTHKILHLNWKFIQTPTHSLYIRLQALNITLNDLREIAINFDGVNHEQSSRDRRVYDYFLPVACFRTMFTYQFLPVMVKNVLMTRSYISGYCFLNPQTFEIFWVSEFDSQAFERVSIL